MPVDALQKNPWRHSFVKSGVPNFDPIFSSGFPYSFFEGSPFAAMKSKPGINHPWVYAAISTIIDSYVQCPLRLFSKRDPKRELIDDHPILKLLSAPNPHMSGTNFLEAIVWNMQLPTRNGQGGQCFVFGDDVNFRKGELPDELWLQSDEGVTPVLNAQKVLQAWKFDYQAGISPYDYGNGMVLEIQQVIRINHFNPYATLSGASPGYPLRAAIGQDAAAAEHNTALLTNGGSSRGVWTSKKPMSAQQFDEFKANLAKVTQGPSNAGKDRFVPWDMEYTPQTLTPEDMQYMEQLGWNRDTVMAVYKVSKFALQQYEDLNYATAKEAKRQLFDQSIFPLNKKIMQEINLTWLDNFKNGDLNLTVDFSQVSALHDDMDARYKRAQILVEIGVPPMIALKMQEIPVDDLKAFSWLMENQSPNSVFNKPAVEDKPPSKSSEKSFHLHNKMELTPEEKLTLSDEFITKVLDPGEGLMAASVRNFFNKQRNRNLDLVDEWAKGKGEAKVEAFKLDKKKEDVAVAQMMRPHYEAQAKRARRHTEQQLANQKDITTDSTDQEIEEFIRQRLYFISVLNDTTFEGVEEKLAGIISDSIKAGDTRAQTATKIRDGLQEVYGDRLALSRTIARTETATVSNKVQYITAENAGMEEKAWLSARSESPLGNPVREMHALADEQGWIAMEEKFVNGMHHPNEDGAPADEVCNCRCTLIFRMRKAA